MKYVSTARQSTYSIGVTAIPTATGGAVSGQEQNLVKCGKCGVTSHASSILLPVENGLPTKAEFDGEPPCGHWEESP